MPQVFTSENPKDQEEIIKYILRLSKEAPVILFRGEMGVGKTTLIKNICNFIKVKDGVSSPTFSLVNEYENEKGESVFHFDFYRIEEETEALDMGVEEYFFSGCICLIEWPEKIKGLLPDKYVSVDLVLKGNYREIKVSTNI